MMKSLPGQERESGGLFGFRRKPKPIARGNHAAQGLKLTLEHPHQCCVVRPAAGDDGVVAGAAGDGAVAAAQFDRAVAGAGDDRVVSVSDVDGIVAVTDVDDGVAVANIDDIVAVAMPPYEKNLADSMMSPPSPSFWGDPQSFLASSLKATSLSLPDMISWPDPTTQ